MSMNISEPLHADFQKTLDNMQTKYGAKRGKSIFYAWINKNKLDDTKARKGQKEEYPDELFASLINEGIELVSEDPEISYDDYEHIGFLAEFKRSMKHQAKMKYMSGMAQKLMPERVVDDSE